MKIYGKKCKSPWKGKMIIFIVFLKEFDSSDYCHDKYLKAKVSFDDIYL